jgi:hypothetical protein
MSAERPKPEVTILTNIYSEEGLSHRVLKHRSGGSPPPESDAASVQSEVEPVVETWMRNLSISACSYHSRGRQPGRIHPYEAPNPEPETDFLPEKKWNTVAESSAAFHVVGVRRPVSKTDRDENPHHIALAMVDKVSTESTTCFHSRRAA